MNCPVCNCAFEGESRFCPHCGAQIDHSGTPNGHGQAQDTNSGQAMPPPNTNGYTYGQGGPGQGPGYHYCKNCGRSLIYGAPACGFCNAPVGMGNQYCPNCANPSNNMASVCTRCGSVLNPGQIPMPANRSKSKLVAGLLGIFLGGFGVHNFYLGYTEKAVIQLILTVVGIVLSCILVGFFMVAGAAIWGLVEGIMILTGSIPADAKGVPLVD